MGSALSRTRSVPTAAPRAAAAVKFPPIPKVPGAPSPTSVENEMQRNQQLVDMLNSTTIVTSKKVTTGADRAGSREAQEQRAKDEGLPVEELVKLLVLHQQQPERWDAEALAQKFNVSDRSSLVQALAHVQAFDIKEDPDAKRMRAIPIGPTEPQPSDQRE
jgi:hypothetical protein